MKIRLCKEETMQCRIVNKDFQERVSQEISTKMAKLCPVRFMELAREMMKHHWELETIKLGK